ncbi:hypothetical protein KM043_015323 [Ampulex compressa]|nr:hypothetical protein KM043_015323 [Ampulex compressa]
MGVRRDEEVRGKEGGRWRKRAPIKEETPKGVRESALARSLRPGLPAVVVSKNFGNKLTAPSRGGPGFSGSGRNRRNGAGSGSALPG